MLGLKLNPDDDIIVYTKDKIKIMEIKLMKGSAPKLGLIISPSLIIVRKLNEEEFLKDDSKWCSNHLITSFDLKIN